jgi:hypothetical protein
MRKVRMMKKMRLQKEGKLQFVFALICKSKLNIFLVAVVVFVCLFVVVVVVVTRKSEGYN